MIQFSDFEKVDIRVGCIISVQEYPASKKPSFKIAIDLGSELGIKQSIGRFPDNYTQEELTGRLVACVVNLAPRQIGPGISEVLTLGFPDIENNAVLVAPDKSVPLGGKLF